jgi:hypothetical protein
MSHDAQSDVDRIVEALNEIRDRLPDPETKPLPSSDSEFCLSLEECRFGMSRSLESRILIGTYDATGKDNCYPAGIANNLTWLPAGTWRIFAERME